VDKMEGKRMVFLNGYFDDLIRCGIGGERIWSIYYPEELGIQFRLGVCFTPNIC
jgi:hypothetical protein